MAVWDCVLVNDELDLLETRLRVLDGVVDHFVVVEADSSFRGDPKPLHVETNAQRFAQWQDKLEVISLSLLHGLDQAQVEFHYARVNPAFTPAVRRAAAEAWVREHEQEKAQEQGLLRAAPDDLILLGDVDEIPYAHVVPWLQANLTEPIRLRQKHAIFRANWVLPLRWCEGTFAFRNRDRDNAQVRIMLGYPTPDLTGYTELELEDAGWHLSYLGSPEEIKRKVSAFSHVEFDNDRVTASRLLQTCQRLRVHFTGRQLMDTVGAESLDDIQRTLRELRPDLYEFGQPEALWRRRRWRSWLWLRGAVSTPAAIERNIDAEGLLMTLLSPVLVVIDVARERRRRGRPDDWAWKRAAILPAVVRP